MSNSITDIPGISVGHASDFQGITGCTVILFDNPATGSIDLRGGGTSTRQIDSLISHNTYGLINGILLTGGSAYGLNAAEGVATYLEENNIGLKINNDLVVPSVPTAVIFDLGIGNARSRPDASMGYEACLNSRYTEIEDGSIGTGTGATIGKIFGIEQATKGGIASSSFKINGELIIGVIAVVNAFGDVVDYKSGRIIAGVRDKNKKGDFLGTFNLFKQGFERSFEPYQNTTLIIIITNGKFSKTELSRIAILGQTGLSRVIVPSNTISDGDIVFAVSCGEAEGNANSIGVIASELVSDTIIKAVRSAQSLGGVPSSSDLLK